MLSGTKGLLGTQHQYLPSQYLPVPSTWRPGWKGSRQRRDWGPDTLEPLQRLSQTSSFLPTFVSAAATHSSHLEKTAGAAGETLLPTLTRRLGPCGAVRSISKHKHTDIRKYYGALVTEPRGNSVCTELFKNKLAPKYQQRAAVTHTVLTAERTTFLNRLVSRAFSPAEKQDRVKRSPEV